MNPILIAITVSMITGLMACKQIKMIIKQMIQRI